MSEPNDWSNIAVSRAEAALDAVYLYKAAVRSLCHKLRLEASRGSIHLLYSQRRDLELLEELYGRMETSPDLPPYELPEE